jgi:hypothetical protein
MSALPPKADIAECDWDARFVPQPDVSNRSNPLEAKGSKIRISQFNGGIVGTDTAPSQISGATRSRLSNQ